MTFFTNSWLHPASGFGKNASNNIINHVRIRTFDQVWHVWQFTHVVEVRTILPIQTDTRFFYEKLILDNSKYQETFSAIKKHLKGNSGVFLYRNIRNYSEKLDIKKRTSKALCVLELWAFRSFSSYHWWRHWGQKTFYHANPYIID